MYDFRYDLIPAWYVERAAAMLVAGKQHDLIHSGYDRYLAFWDGLGWCWRYEI